MKWSASWRDGLGTSVHLGTRLMRVLVLGLVFRVVYKNHEEWTADGVLVLLQVWRSEWFMIQDS